MFDIGFWELTLIAVVALLVVGPERLPGLARNVGRWVGRIRRYVSAVRDDIEREIRADELRELMEKSKRSNPLADLSEETGDALGTARKELESAEKESAEKESAGKDDDEKSGAAKRASESAAKKTAGAEGAGKADDAGQLPAQPDAGGETRDAGADPAAGAEAVGRAFGGRAPAGSDSDDESAVTSSGAGGDDHERRSG